MRGLGVVVLAGAGALAVSLPAVAREGAAWTWRERAPLPLPRGGVRFLYQTPPTANGHVFVIHYYVFEYDPASDTWTTHKSVQPTLRPHYAAAALGGKLYAIGGSKDGGPRDWLTTMEEFDPETRSWRACAPMPGARRNTGAASIDGQVYVFGGEGEAEGAMPIVAYDPRADRWAQKKAATRVRHCWGVQVVRGKAYIFGTASHKESEEPVLEVYDPVRDTVEGRSPLPRARMAYATALAGERIVVLGGTHGGNVPLGEVDVYDPATDKWSTAPDLPRPKSWFGAAVVGGSLYVLGGVAGDFANPDKDVYELGLADGPLAPSRAAPPDDPSRPAAYDRRRSCPRIQMQEGVSQFFSSDHRRLDSLLEAAVAEGDHVDLGPFGEFRGGLLRHIGMEEKLLFPALRAALPDAASITAKLRVDHGALTALLVPTPTPQIVARIRSILEPHNDREEGPEGVYRLCERALSTLDAERLLEKARAFPEPPLNPYNDGPSVERHVADAVELSRRQWAKEGEVDGG